VKTHHRLDPEEVKFDTVHLQDYINKIEANTTKNCVENPYGK